jgi:hypothetical protein
LTPPSVAVVAGTSATVPDVVIGPPIKPVPVPTLVTVPPKPGVSVTTISGSWLKVVSSLLAKEAERLLLGISTTP